MNHAAANQDYQAALAHHRAGRLAEAGALYQRILAEYPRHADALHMLGIMASQNRRDDLAAEMLLQAVEAAPRNALFRAELGEMYRRIGRLEEAAEQCWQALALQPCFVDGHYNLGVIQQQMGQLAAAAESYRAVLNLEAGHAEARCNLGNALRDLGRLDEAVAAYRQVLALQPQHVGARGNLGVALTQQGKWDEAVACFQRVLELRPNDALAHNALGNVWQAQGKREEAMAAYRQAIACDAEYALAHANLGRELLNAGNMEEALESCRRAVALKPARSEPYQNLGFVLEKLGQLEEAGAMYREALARGVQSADVRYCMAAVGGVAAPEGAPAEHLVPLFGAMAETFDERLVEVLGYRGPQILFDAVMEADGCGGDVAGFGDVLDIGCGTGLCGPLFRPHARTLAGMDLSGPMVEKARQRNIYDELWVAEITAALEARPGAFDMVVAADVLIYFGDLDRLFAGAAAALRPGGTWAFTVEEHEGDGYKLYPTRRYAHSVSYLRTVAARHGFLELALRRGQLRREGKQEVPGVVMVMGKG